MKKQIAWILIFCLMMQLLPGSAISALAETTDNTVLETLETQNSVREEEVADNKENEKMNEKENTGILEVKVSSALPIQKKSTVQVSILGENDVSEKQSLLVGGDGVSTETARFEELASGDYTVTVSADKFADYTQKVSVQKDQIARIQVYSGQIHTGSNAHPGWIRLGDVNDDSVVDAQDQQMLLDILHEGSMKENADLNSDSAADLVDLQYLVQSMGENQLSTVETLFLSAPNIDANTKIEKGNLNDLMQDGASVIFRSESGATISMQHPIGVEFTLAGEEEEAKVMEGMTVQAPIQQNGETVNNIAQGSVTVTVDNNGQEKEYIVPISMGNENDGDITARTKAALKRQARISGENEQNAEELNGAKVTVDANGALTIDFGRQIAVKKVSIKITGTTQKNAALIEIAKVEFVNDMASRIPAPQLDIPDIKNIEADNQALTVSWSKENNITGYDVYISGPTKDQSGTQEQIVRVADTTHRFTTINGKKLKNFSNYTIKVRSVNGDWTSPWSTEKIGVPAPQKLPAPPDNVTVEGGFASISVSWKAMDDANGYMVYYRKKNEGQFQPVVKDFVENKEDKNRIEKNSYTITGLEKNVEYEVYVKSWNELGWGEKSLTALATTKDGLPPILPNYHLINTPNEQGELTNHIVTATIGGAYGGKMVGSLLDEAGVRTGLGLVDNDFGSYWMLENWDDGAYNVGSLGNGMIVTLDKDYEMSYLTFGAVDPKSTINLVKIRYWNTENGDTELSVQAKIIEKTDAKNNRYYIVRFDEPITANKVHMRLGRSWMDMSAMKVGEIHFHEYDPLEKEIDSIYADETHTTLKKDVNEETIANLEARLDEPDEATGEKHPLYKELKLDLQTAKELLNGTLSAVYSVNPGITAQKDTHLGFTGLNAWQPLGKTAYAGEVIQVMVGHSSKRNGERADLQLVVTQYHAESNSVAKTVNLNVGKNEITIPKLSSNDFERGGQLYIAYTGNNSKDSYAVRVNGGSDIPVLNLYKKTGQDRKDAIKNYINQLETYQSTIQTKHEELHKQETSSSVAYDYDEENCILNATDILMDKMMYSLPATQVWKNINGSTTDEKVEALDKALKAMEDTMTLFYQHKGLSDSADSSRGKNALPSQHLNIRYMRMFAGAFMYAAGNHIGIGWGSATLTGANSWDDFGWGIAHEIGHDINQGSYAVAEITNNYFAQLLTKATKGTRFAYEDVYKKVTSGTTGMAADGAVQLAFYWQLHLAYDDNKDDRAIYDAYNDQWKNLFFARVDTYARNPGKAPEGTLTLGSDTDQNLMRLACAAAGKNILPFFERWGMVPDETTRNYAALYGESEEKALYYVNDAVRDYRVDHKGEEDTLSLKGKEVATASVKAESNKVTLNIQANEDVNKDSILGYEIIRTMTANGKKEAQVVGFIEAGKDGNAVFTDTVSTINNRVMEYKVKAVDKFLNYAKSTNAGAVKIETEGILNKDAWTVETNMVSEDDVDIVHDNEDPDSGYHTDPSKAEHAKVNSIDRIIDNNTMDENAIYKGQKEEDSPQITIDMHKTEEVTALKYMGSDIEKLTIEVSEDGKNWITVKENSNAASDCTEKYATVWFDAVEESERESWIGTYDARYLRLTMPETETVTINEIEICGPSGDNLEFMKTEDKKIPAVGILETEYKYGNNEDDVIPAGSLIFSGQYKGNPAYNVVVLYDEDGNIIGANPGDEEAGIAPSVEAEQVIFADVPEQGNLGEVSDGTWIYYVEPGKWNEEDVKGLTVRGELYRVDNALTLEGERVVSDTLPLTVDQLPKITLTGMTLKK